MHTFSLTGPNAEQYYGHVVIKWCLFALPSTLLSALNEAEKNGDRMAKQGGTLWQPLAFCLTTANKYHSHNLNYLYSKIYDYEHELDTNIACYYKNNSSDQTMLNMQICEKIMYDWVIKVTTEALSTNNLATFQNKCEHDLPFLHEKSFPLKTTKSKSSTTSTNNNNNNDDDDNNKNSNGSDNDDGDNNNNNDHDNDTNDKHDTTNNKKKNTKIKNKYTKYLYNNSIKKNYNNNQRQKIPNPVDIDMSYVFQKLEPANIIRVFRAILNNEQILIFSTELHLLFPICETFLALIYPFKYVTSYIPILPIDIAQVEEGDFFNNNFNSFLFGVEKTVLTRCSRLSDSIVQVDLDTNTVWGGRNECED